MKLASVLQSFHPPLPACWGWGWGALLEHSQGLFLIWGQIPESRVTVPCRDIQRRVEVEPGVLGFLVTSPPLVHIVEASLFSSYQALCTLYMFPTER